MLQYLSANKPYKSYLSLKKEWLNNYKDRSINNATPTALSAARDQTTNLKQLLSYFFVVFQGYAKWFIFVFNEFILILIGNYIVYPLWNISHNVERFKSEYLINILWHFIEKKLLVSVWLSTFKFIVLL